MEKRIIIGAIAAVTLAGGAVYFGADTKPSVMLDTATAEHVVWEKPTTDAEWAEDTKKESLDFRSDKVLQEMIAAHTSKLDREIKAFKKYQECPECIYYEKYEQFFAGGMEDAEAQAEAQNAADTEIAQRGWSIEKLQQSIERMDKEVELRASGFLIVAGQKPTGPRFGGTVPPNRVRTIHE